MNSGKAPYFVMHHQLPGLWQALLADKTIRSADVATWHLLQLHVSPSLGAVLITPEHLGGLYGLSRSHMLGSVARLKKALLVATWVDPRTRQRMLLLNPFVASMGNRQRRGWVWTRFCEATDGKAAATFNPDSLQEWAVDPTAEDFCPPVDITSAPA